MAYNILLVDDSETVRAVIVKALEMANLPVGRLHHAGNGEEALAVLGKEWVDLVFADLNMPVMNGVEMLARMKADDGMKAVPVIVVSTEGSVKRIRALMDSGVDAFLRKPFTPETIKTAVESVLGSWV
jgi:two-component system chemotaxis response regulator CheY